MSETLKTVSCVSAEVSNIQMSTSALNIDCNGQFKYWAITRNILDCECEDDFKQTFDDWRKTMVKNKSVTFIQIQLEKGLKTSRLHYQGVICFDYGIRRNTLIKLHTPFFGCANLQPSRSSAIYDYTSKEDTRVDPPFIYGNKPENKNKTKITKKALKVIVELYLWQASVVYYIKNECDDRRINWLFDPNCGAGKTSLTKYLYSIMPTCIASRGRYEDLAQIVRSFGETNDLNDTFLFLYNVPKETDPNKISYSGLENIKDGLITSPKYESSTLVFNSPIVWVMANCLPIVNKVDPKRWKIYTIIDNELKDYSIDNKEHCLIEKDI